jgi:hypothetical protein
MNLLLFLLISTVSFIHASVDPRDPRVDDRLVIQQLLTRYAHSVDRRDWKRFKSIFTDDATIDYTANFMGDKGNVDHIIQYLDNNLIFFGTTVHHVINIDITFKGPNSANVTAYIDNPMFFLGHHLFSGSPTLYVRGFYHHELIKTSDGVWKSKRLWEEIISASVPVQILNQLVFLALYCVSIYFIIQHVLLLSMKQGTTGKKKN